MQKLKLYVTETKYERRKLIGLEYVIFRCHLDGCAIATKYLLDSGYRQGTTINGVAEFETTHEREATDDEFWAWLDYKKECIRIGVEYFSPMRDELKDKEFRIEVVEE